LVTQPN